MLGKWYEIWVDNTPSDPYVLIVTPNTESEEEILIIDILRGYLIIHRDCDYDAIAWWLSEDEYRKVKGRMDND